MMNTARFRDFIARMSALVDQHGADEPRIFAEGGTLLADLVRHDDWLPPEFARASAESYRQYLLYCDPRERFSVVSFVWGPGHRAINPGIRVEVLVPDFRGKGKIERALEILSSSPPDVFNHNIETVEALYRNVRPGADYRWSLDLLARFKARHPGVPTKSGIMLGLGESLDQVCQTLRDLRAHDVDMITIGQYLQPTAHHHPVMRYWTPEEFKSLEQFGYGLGFSHMACGPLVRSSYHADLSAEASGMVPKGWPAD
jgi:hypothetical protein